MKNEKTLKTSKLFLRRINESVQYLRTKHSDDPLCYSLDLCLKSNPEIDKNSILIKELRKQYQIIDNRELAILNIRFKFCKIINVYFHNKDRTKVGVSEMGIYLNSQIKTPDEVRDILKKGVAFLTQNKYLALKDSVKFYNFLTFFEEKGFSCN